MAHSERSLLAFIEDARARGLTHEQIAEAVAAGGFTVKQVADLILAGKSTAGARRAGAAKCMTDAGLLKFLRRRGEGVV
jgi:hypothetical protein